MFISTANLPPKKTDLGLNIKVRLNLNQDLDLIWPDPT